MSAPQMTLEYPTRRPGRVTVATHVRTAASYLLLAGGGALATRLYESLSDLARRIGAGDRRGAAAALFAARATLIRTCQLTGWRRVRPTPLTADALDQAEAWVKG